MKQETILCAAIWYHDFETIKDLPLKNPNNVEHGVVICGHRHGNCIHIMNSITGLRSVEKAGDALGKMTQGFLTNKNRFVNRIEAMQIATKENQLLFPENVGKILFSEDIY